MKIGIISAMDDEHRQLAERLSDKRENTEGTFRYVEGCAGDNELVLTQCGIGKVNAAIGAAELIHRYHPDCIISTGVAGGMAGCLRVGDVVVGESMVYHDVWCGDGNAYGQIQDMPAVYRGNQTLLECARRLNEQDIESSVHTGLICTGDQFVTEQEVQESIRTHFPDVMAVDMESAAIAQTCHIYGVPFLSFRIISDTPGVEEHWSQYCDFWATMADRSFQTTWAFLSTLPQEL